MSGGSDTSTATTSIPSWVEPYAKNFLNTSQQVANLPYQGYDGQTVAQLNPFQTQAYNAQAQRAVQGSPVNDAASGELQKTLSGGYLGKNPYLSGMIDSASQDVTRNYNQSVIPQLTALDARSGSFGNSGVGSATTAAQGQLAQQLGNIATNIRGNDYAAERGRMQTAVSQAPGIANQDYIDAQMLGQAGAGFQAQNQANLTDDYTRFTQARDDPQQQLNTLGKGLGLNYGSTQTATSPGQSPVATGLGTAASLWGLSNMSGGK
jgi:hypothetical protein